MLKFAVIAARRKSQAKFGPFNSHELAEQFANQLAANTQIVYAARGDKFTPIPRSMQ